MMKTKSSSSKKVILQKKNYPNNIKPNFPTFGCSLESKESFKGGPNRFVHDDSIKHLSGFDSVVIYENFNF